MLYDEKGKLKCAALSLFTYIKLALEAEAARRSNSGDPLVIMRFTANGLAPRYYLVAPTHAGQTSNFEAELFEMVPETQLPEASDTFPAVNFSFVADTTVNCKPWPKIIRELVLVRELLRYAVGWNISILTSCASTPNMRLVDKATPVVLEDLLQADRRRKEAEKLRREAEKAKHLTDVMLGLAAPPNRNTNKGKGKFKGKRPGKGKGKGPSVGNDKDGANTAQGDDKGQDGPSKAFGSCQGGEGEEGDSSTDESASEPDSSEEYWMDILRSLEAKALAKAAPVMGAVTATGAAHGLCGPIAATQPVVADTIAGTGAVLGERATGPRIAAAVAAAPAILCFQWSSAPISLFITTSKRYILQCPPPALRYLESVFARLASPYVRQFVVQHCFASLCIMNGESEADIYGKHEQRRRRA